MNNNIVKSKMNLGRRFPAKAICAQLLSVLILWQTIMPIALAMPPLPKRSLKDLLSTNWPIITHTDNKAKATKPNESEKVGANTSINANTNTSTSTGIESKDTKTPSELKSRPDTLLKTAPNKAIPFNVKPVIAPVPFQLSGDTAVVHQASLNGGKIEGSLRLLTNQSLNFNSGLVITSDVFVPGTPSLNINGTPTYNGTVVGTGASTPSGYSININSGVTLRHIVTHTDPITVPTVGTPTSPTGNQNVVLNAGQGAPNFSQLRDLTVNSSYGIISVPPGNYGNFIFNNGDTLVLGTTGQNTTYNLQGLTLNSTSNLQILGNTTINILNQVNINGSCTVGSAAAPTALAMNITNGGLTLNSSNTNFYGIVKTNGNVTINGNTKLKGTVTCNQLTLNSQGLLQGLTSDTQNPVVNITSPTDGAIIRAAQTNVTGTYSDDSAVTLKANNINASTITSTGFTVNNVPLTLGTNTITAVATDVFGNTTQSSITVYRADATNQVPVVNAGASQTITLPSSATLNGTATDDGLPSGSSLSINWSKVSGPGTVTFANPNSAQTTATFSVAGTYVLKLTASDGQLPASALTTVTVNAAASNIAPTVSAGSNQTIAFGAMANLIGTATDDGLPNPPAQVTTTWSKVSGSGTVTFANANALTTTATFSVAGTYTLRLTASDSALSATSDVVITVTAANTAPTVSAGTNQTITLPATASLVGTATDDGLPNPPAQVTTTWSKVSGAGNVTFANPNALSTTATFSVAGTYVLRLTASDSVLSSTSDVTITVNPVAPQNQAPVVNAGANQTVNLEDNLIQNGSNEATLVNSQIPNWTNVTGNAWTQASAGTNGFPPALSGNIYFYAGSVANAELRQDINVAAFATAIATGTQQFEFRGYLRSLNETPADGTQVIVEYRDSTNTNVLASYDSTVLTSINSWQLVANLRTAPVGTAFIRIRLLATRNTGTSNDGFFDNLSLRAKGLAATTLTGTATDDGLPTGSTLAVTWTKVSGPGTVVFGAANQVATAVTFNQTGTYVLRLTATDSLLSSSSDITLTVADINQAPTSVSAGSDQTITLPNSASLVGNYLEDGIPVGANVVVTWSKVSGTGTVTFGNNQQLATTASFSAAGTYVLRLTINDSALTSTNDVTITVNAATPENQAPTVSAGSPQTITLPATATLTGTVTDDGLPNPPAQVTVIWSKLSGSGTVTFANPNALTTTASFSVAGIYTLRLTASDSALSSTSDVVITVNSPVNQAPVVNAGANQTLLVPYGLNLIKNPGGEATITNGIPPQWSDAPGGFPANWFKPTAGTSPYPAAVEGNSYFAAPNTGPFGGSSIIQDVDVSAYSQSIAAGTQIFTFNGFLRQADETGGAQITIFYLSAGGATLATASSSTQSSTDWTLFSDVRTAPVGTQTIRISLSCDGGYVDALSLRPLLGVSNLPLANLAGSVTDDGLPNPPAQVTVNWTTLSGPGIVTFTNPNQATTTASFSNLGTYVLRLTASDSILSTSSDTTITVQNSNHANVIVSAGADQTLLVPYGPNLIKNPGGEDVIVGGLPNHWSLAPGGFPFSWFKPTAGTPPYPAALEGSSYFAATLVSAGGNGIIQDVDVSAYSQTIAAGTQTFAFNGSIQQDGNGGVAQLQISYLAANGTTLASATSGLISPSFWQVFSDARTAPVGTQTIRITIISYNGYVDALSLRAVLGTSIVPTTNLTGSVTENSQPVDDRFSIQWTQISGTGATTFSQPNKVQTAVTFSDVGTYVLRLTASDFNFSLSDDVTIIVKNINNPNNVVVNAGPDQTLTVAYSPNLLKNPGGEAPIFGGTPNNWLVPGGFPLSWFKPTAGTPPYPAAQEGSSYFAANLILAGGNALIQDVDVSAYSQTIAAGTQVFAFSGSIQQDGNGGWAQLQVSYLAANGAVLASAASGLMSPTSWQVYGDARTAPVGTQTIRITLLSYNGYIDDLSLRAVIGTSVIPTTNLTGSVTENGQPVDDRLSLQWTQVSGSGTATFSQPHKVQTAVTFSDIGTYVLRLTASDLSLLLSDDITVVVKGLKSGLTVNAGGDRTIRTNPTLLFGQVTYDGFPVLNIAWSKVSGPGNVTFADSHQPTTSVSFDTPGMYVLRLTANDSQTSASDDVVINFNSSVDLQVNSFNTAALVVDGQTLAATGTVSAQVINASTNNIATPFKVTFFEDLNANGRLDADDNLLATITLASLAAQGSQTVSASINSHLLFANNPIYVYVDSTNVIAETDEDNNYLSSITCSSALAPINYNATTLKFSWTQEGVIMTPLVADLNGDGISDIVFITLSGLLVAISGDDGHTLFSANYNLIPDNNLVLGDIDGDNKPDIIGITTSQQLIAINSDGSFKWKSPVAINTDFGVAPLIVDLDGDGVPEIVVGWQAFNADGSRRWVGQGGHGELHYDTIHGYGAIASTADLNLDGLQEVIAGNTAYDQQGNILWYDSNINDSYTAVGNFNSDPFPEIVLMNGRATLLDHLGQIIWQTPFIDTYGPPAILDVDGDGIPEIAVAGVGHLTLINSDSTVRWSIPTQDVSSRATAVAGFDFDGDGKTEIVYGDELKLIIVRGSDGVILFQYDRPNGTSTENPVIADLDGDGHADLITVANTIFSGTLQGVFVFSNNSWAGARRVWNEHAYHVTNVNNDATIPQSEKNNINSFNNFRVQTAAASASDCQHPLPDLSPSYVRTNNSGNNLVISARVGNGGSANAPTGVVVAFYNANPSNGGTVIGTTTTNQILKGGQYEDVSISIPNTTVVAPLWVVVDSTNIVSEISETNNAYNSQIFLGTATLIVNAGADQTTTLPNATVTLTGSVIDNNPGGNPTLAWTKVSGPANVSFSTPNQASTQATFTVAGAYTLRLTATDLSVVVSDDVIVVVNAATNQNQAPVVNAGNAQTVTLASNLVLNPGNEAALVNNAIPNWTVASGSWAQASPGTNNLPPAFEGQTYFYAGDVANGELYQDVDISAFGGTIATGTQKFDFQAYVRTQAETPSDTAQIIVEQRDAAQNVLAVLDTGNLTATDWTPANAQITPVAGTVSLRIRLIATRNSGTANDGYFDAISLVPVTSAGLKLNGSVTDDGLPTPPAQVSINWSKVSGPGTVVFSTPNQAITGAVFTTAGSYVLRLSADDSALVTTSDVTITVSPANIAPIVSAGSPQTITLPATATLTGSVTDDGLPSPPAQVTVQWSQVSGSGTVSFSNAQATSTVATFSTAGTYVLRLTANDSALSSSSDVTITVNAATGGNQAPVVSAGSNQTITLPATATLTGSVTDDGLPSPPAQVTVLWSQVSGSGTVSFSNVQATSTTATFSTAGTYILRLTASDSALSSSSDVTITVNAAGTNQAPVVSAGSNQTITFGDSATLNATVTDDGLPSPPAHVTVTWTQVSGTGTATFTNPNNSATLAMFSAIGTYVLRITADDSLLSTSSDVTVIVNATNTQPPTVVINSPDDGTEITKPTDIFATISGGTWTLDYALNGDDDPGLNLNPQYTTLATGTGAVTNSKIWQLDPTMMLNGSYSLRLSSTENGLTTTYIIATIVTRNLKIGNFSVSFNDLSIPVQGIPLTVVRTYDTRNSGRKGDFGYGWNLDVKSVRLEKSSNLGTNWVETVDPDPLTARRYGLQPSRPKVVTITFSDGKVYKFDAKPNPSQQLQAIVDLHDLNFVAEPGTLGTLVHMEPADLQVIGDIPETVPGAGNVQIIRLTEPRYGEPFNPTLFKFTTQEGTEFIIDEKLGLLSAKDLNGNELVIDSTGITSRNGSTIRAQVAFTRDSQNRITRVTDPMGNFSQYGYNSNGDLVSFTNQENNNITFTYLTAHKLFKIINPLGIASLTNTYDDNGRLISHTDANGKTITYTHNLGTHQEIVTDRLGHATTLGYDDRGNVLTKIDSLGNATTYTYDALDNQLTETNALGNSASATYDAFNNKLTQTDPLGHITTFTYNSRRQVLTVTDPKGNITSNTYDNKGNLISTTDASGATTAFTVNSVGVVTDVMDALNNSLHFGYNIAGNLTSINDPLNHTINYTYDNSGNLLTETTTRSLPNGNIEALTTSYQYDKLNRQTSITYPNGTTNQTIYNEIGKVVSATDSVGRITTYQYDQLGQKISTTLPDNSVVSVTYDAEGRRLTGTDQAGHTTLYQYDSLGRTIKTTLTDGSFAATTYDVLGRATTNSDLLGHLTTYEYDANNRQTKVTDALGHSTTITYDNNGNQLSVTDASGKTTSYEYDTSNRQTKTIFPNNTSQSITYDIFGRVIAKTDQAGKVTQLQYDNLGRLTQVTDALNQVTSYSYNEIGQQIAQIDALGRTTRYEYDQIGRRTKRILPLGQTEALTYDSAGNLANHTDFNGKTTTFNYNNLNQLVSKNFDASFGQIPVTYTYSTTGQRTSMTDASGTTVYSYDSRNRLTNKQTPFGTLTYTYDANGSLLTTRSSNAQGVSLDYSYDQLNRLKTVKDNRLGTTQSITNYNYDTVGNLASISLPNSVATSYTYNTLNQLTNVTSTQTVNTVASYTYTLGTAGNRLSVAELSGRTVNYSYDAIYRLLGETIANATPSTQNGTINYSYDAASNRLTRNSTVAAVPTQTAISYDNNDRLNSDQYDNNGNTVGADGRTYIYDAENRIVGVTGPNTAISISYDGDGNRVSKTANGLTTNYLVDANNLTGYTQVVEELQNNQVVRQYTYGLDLISERQRIGSNFETSFYGKDGHGSVRYLTDASGTVTDTYDYDAFGNLIGQTGSTPNLYLYASEQLDPDLGLYYNRARYLDVNRGRFWNQDSFEGTNSDPASLHKYLYAANNPINRRDPSGHLSNLQELGAVGAISGILAGLSNLYLTGDANDPEGSIHRAGLAAAGFAGGVFVAIGIATVASIIVSVAPYIAYAEAESGVAAAFAAYTVYQGFIQLIYEGGTLKARRLIIANIILTSLIFGTVIYKGTYTPTPPLRSINIGLSVEDAAMIEAAYARVDAKLGRSGPQATYGCNELAEAFRELNNGEGYLLQVVKAPTYPNKSSIPGSVPSSVLPLRSELPNPPPGFTIHVINVLENGKVVDPYYKLTYNSFQDYVDATCTGPVYVTGFSTGGK